METTLNSCENCEYKQQEIDKWKIAYQQEAEDHMITSNNLQKEIEIRDKEITNLKIEQHFNLKLINELKAAVTITSPNHKPAPV